MSACALYMAKTPQNNHIIQRSIETRAQELADAPLPDDPLEMLARAQALLLYLIIRVLDGDQRPRVSETIMAVLKQASFALMEFTAFEKGTFAPMGCVLSPQFAPRADEVPPDHLTHEFWEVWYDTRSLLRHDSHFWLTGLSIYLGSFKNQQDERS